MPGYCSLIVLALRGCGAQPRSKTALRPLLDSTTLPLPPQSPVCSIIGANLLMGSDSADMSRYIVPPQYTPPTGLSCWGEYVRLQEGLLLPACVLTCLNTSGGVVSILVRPQITVHRQGQPDVSQMTVNSIQRGAGVLMVRYVTEILGQIAISPTSLVSFPTGVSTNVHPTKLMNVEATACPYRATHLAMAFIRQVEPGRPIQQRQSILMNSRDLTKSLSRRQTLKKDRVPSPTADADFSNAFWLVHNSISSKGLSTKSPANKRQLNDLTCATKRSWNYITKFCTIEMPQVRAHAKYRRLPDLKVSMWQRVVLTMPWS